MKSLIASAFLALTIATTSSSFAADHKETAKTQSTYQSVVYPVVNTSKIRVNVNKDKNAKINVTLKNETGEILASERLGKGHESSAIRFDLNQLQDGIYQVEISDGNTKQVKEVKLQTSSPTVTTERHIAMN
ncbi:T9SS type A sorting domain-containing protein [Larkinella sp. C7]|uniref:T9SS type A sorting domain-containing protein n=1 Tax=Larkinella sp. C7 TaxID=2576607 RepID=UPI0011110CD2|nr:T9SS type A sorting domain-containing protein [Larkinella sp. C7]